MSRSGGEKITIRALAARRIWYCGQACATVRRVQQDTSLSGATGADPDLSWRSGQYLRQGPYGGLRHVSGRIRTPAIEMSHLPRPSRRARNKRTWWPGPGGVSHRQRQNLLYAIECAGVLG